MTGSPARHRRPSARTSRPRWRGQPGRQEVWYLSLSDPRKGLGAWVHHELVAPLAGSPYRHGWAALFRLEEPPVLARFGPEPLPGPVPHASDAGSDPGSVRQDPWAEVAGLVSTDEARLAFPRVEGRAGELAWALELDPAPGELWTFPRWVWEDEALPGSQVLPVASRDPDGSTATCRNSELADASIRLERRVGGGWEPEGDWVLTASAHVEVGVRP